MARSILAFMATSIHFTHGGTTEIGHVRVIEVTAMLQVRTDDLPLYHQMIYEPKDSAELALEGKFLLLKFGMGAMY